MYELLNDFVQRPAPFSRYTAKALWTRPHLARQMLSYHLNQETDLASRRFETIDRVVEWLDGQLALSGKSLCDLGCGPGLYTRRFAERGATVSGVDFSEHSIAYARRQAEEGAQAIAYHHADYLEGSLPSGFDLVTLIYCDLCALSPEQRSRLLGRVRGMLNPGGRIVLDVAGMGSFAHKGEATVMEDRLMGGFWADGEYVGIQRSFVYPEQALALDRYLIVEPGDRWEIFNWFQHYTLERLERELRAAGFAIESLAGSLTGDPLDPEGESIAAIARLG